MKKDIQVLKHASLKELPLPGSNTTRDDFSTFYSNAAEQEALVDAFFKKSFRSDFFTVIHVRAEHMQLRIDFNDYTAGKNTLLFSSPNSVKQLISMHPGCIMEGISFTSDFLTSLKLHEKIVELMEYFSSRHIPLWQLQPAESRLLSARRKQIERRLARAGSHLFGQELLANSFADFLFEIGEIGQKYSVSRGLKFGRKEELVIRFSRLAMQHYQKEKNLSFYSNALFVTAKHLSETTKEITGKTAGMIIDELNLMEAKRLLEESELGIAEIAYRLHFSNPAFFSKFFSRLSGSTPRAYRQTAQNRSLRSRRS